MQKLKHRNNSFSLEVAGNYRDSDDSMYFISSKESWHVTFVKISKDRVEEHLRKVIVMEGLNELYLSEVEFTYCSEYETVRSYRSFLRKQKEFDDFKDILQVYFQKHTIKQTRSFDFDSDVPF